MTWTEAQRSRDYVVAKKHLADFLPELAIPRIKLLLALPDLDKAAKPELLTLLGEAQVRTALDEGELGRSALLTEALETLADPSLQKFSPAHLWRSYALTHLGRLRDAINELNQIDRSSMIDQAHLQMATLMAAIGDTTEAKTKLVPLLKSTDPSLKKQATLKLISVAIMEDEADEADRLLTTYQPSNPREEGLQNYLNGRIQLLRRQRLQAGGTFQYLTGTQGIEQLLPSEIFHEATLALADSLALEDNEEAGVSSLLQTLEKHPNSPRMEGIFTRFKAWSPKIETAALIAKLSTWVPQPNQEPIFTPFREGASAGAFAVTTTQEILPPRSLYALEFIASTNLQSADPAVRARGIKQTEQLQLAGRIDSPIINRSLFELGLALMKDGNHQGSLTYFNLLSETSRSTLRKAYAQALAGQASFAMKNPEEASKAFLEAARIAKRLRRSSLQTVSELNAGIALLTTTRSKDLDTITGNLRTPEAKSFLILERGLYLSTRNDPGARDLLTSFISDFPSNPRKDEATLALAESSVFCEPADPELTALMKSEISSLKFSQEGEEIFEARRILVLLALGIGQDQATDFITKSPDHPLSPRLLFTLGQTQRSLDPIGKAYATFEKFLTAYPDSEFAEAARYLSARSSASSGTESAQKNAIIRFRELIQAKGALAHEAAISLASLLIDREQQDAALIEINRHLETAKLNNSDRRRLLILGADASGQLGKHQDVLTYYQKLLKLEDLPNSTLNQANFQKGVAFERLGNKAEALKAYLTVVNRDFEPAKTTNLEWKWFDKCGIEGALALLERDKRWDAAISLAEKLAMSGSPRAKDARESAERIALEQKIWRDK